MINDADQNRKQTTLYEFAQTDLMCDSCLRGLLNPCTTKQARIACYIGSMMSEAKQNHQSNGGDV